MNGSNRSSQQSNKPVGRKPGQAAQRRPQAANSQAVKPKTARELALDVLTRVDTEKAYSNLLLNQSLQKHKLEKAEAGLATELVYGTIQRKNTIDYFLRQFVTKGYNRLEPWVNNLLRMSFYQLYYLDRVPEHAAVNEAVNIAKRKGHSGISGMVNGVLRSVIRSKSQLRLPDNLSDISRLALEQSHPEWLVADWARRFGLDTAERICRANNEPPRVSLRINTLRTTVEAMLEQLEQAGHAVRRSALTTSGIIVDSGGNMALTPWYAAGALSIQDESSMLVAELVDPQPGMNVLDCCAAPGGKAAHMAELMRDRGRIAACDLHEHKRELIDAQAKRLHLASIEAKVLDARTLPESLEGQTFERILLDAPCSGLGVIRRKPDIKWAKEPQHIAEIAELQSELLAKAAKLLAPDGVLVYSTCTLAEQENEQVVRRFLLDHPDFSLELPPTGMLQRLPEGTIAGDGFLTLLPTVGSDGFFMARLRRRQL